MMMNKVELFLVGIIVIQSVFVFVLLRQLWLANKATKNLINVMTRNSGRTKVTVRCGVDGCNCGGENK